MRRRSEREVVWKLDEPVACRDESHLDRRRLTILDRLKVPVPENRLARTKVIPLKRAPYLATVFMSKGVPKFCNFSLEAS